MPSNRQPSKQRRAAQNRAAREALATRKLNANRPQDEPATSTTSGSAKSSSSRSRATRSSSVREPTTRAGRFIAAANSELPGAKAALLAFLFSVGASVSLLFLPVHVDEHGNALTPKEISARKDAGKPDLTDGFLSASGPTGVIIIVLPPAAAGLGLYAVRKRSSRRMLTGALFASAIIAVGSGVPVLFMPSVIALAVASFQVRKAEREAAQDDALDDEEPDAPDELVTVEDGSVVDVPDEPQRSV